MPAFLHIRLCIEAIMKPILGSIVALITPMHEDGSVDFDTLRKLIDWQDRKSVV